MVLTLIEAAPPPAAASQRRVLPCCLPQELQGLILQPLLLFGFEAHHLLDLARVERPSSPAPPLRRSSSAVAVRHQTSSSSCKTAGATGEFRAPQRCANQSRLGSEPVSVCCSLAKRWALSTRAALSWGRRIIRRPRRSCSENPRRSQKLA